MIEIVISTLLFHFENKHSDLFSNWSWVLRKLQPGSQLPPCFLLILEVDILILGKKFVIWKFGEMIEIDISKLLFHFENKHSDLFSTWSWVLRKLQPGSQLPICFLFPPLHSHVWVKIISSIIISFQNTIEEKLNRITSSTQKNSIQKTVCWCFGPHQQYSQPLKFLFNNIIFAVQHQTDGAARRVQEGLLKDLSQDSVLQLFVWPGLDCDHSKVTLGVLERLSLV